MFDAFGQLCWSGDRALTRGRGRPLGGRLLFAALGAPRGLTRPGLAGSRSEDDRRPVTTLPLAAPRKQTAICAASSVDWAAPVQGFRFRPSVFAEVACRSSPAI